MKTNVLWIAIVVFLLLNVNLESKAQIDFGIKAGVSSTKIKMDDLKQENTDSLLMKAGDAKVGIHVGLVARVSILGFYLQPELLFTANNAEIKVRDLAGEYDYKSLKFTKVDIPIMFGKKIGPFRMQAGPIASIMLSNNSKLSDFANASDEFKKATWGYQAGIGLDIWKIIIDLKYEGNFSKLSKNQYTIGNRTYSTDSRNPQWVLSFGYFF